MKSWQHLIIYLTAWALDCFYKTHVLHFVFKFYNRMIVMTSFYNNVLIGGRYTSLSQWNVTFKHTFTTMSHNACNTHVHCRIVNKTQVFYAQNKLWNITNTVLNKSTCMSCSSHKCDLKGSMCSHIKGTPLRSGRVTQLKRFLWKPGFLAVDVCRA